MDIATIVGLLVAAALMLGAMWHQTHGHIGAFYSTEGVLLVIGGSMAATMVSMPLRNFLSTMRVVRKLFFCKDTPLPDIVQKLAEFATIARKDGLLALENEVQDLRDPFLAKGLRMVIDGQDHHEVETNLRLELYALGERHTIGKKTFTIMGNYGPAFGLSATVIGQVVMFQNMGSDISAIGGGLSVALLGTLYGTLFANVVCLPFADKLGIRAAQEMLSKELQLQGILGIAQGDSPTALKQRLLSFLDGRTASKVEAAK